MIVLTPRQAQWIAAHVEAGEYPSVEDAVSQLIDERIADREFQDSDDLDWAKPFLEEGLAALERGETISLEEHKARNAARLAALKR